MTRLTTEARTRPHIFRLLTLAAVMLLAIAPLAGTTPAAHAQRGHKLKVVASFSILGDWLTNVAGDYIDLNVLVPAGGDTHTFDPSPDQVAAIADADLVFEIGAGFEPWLDDIYDASGATAKRVVVSDGVTLRTLDDPDADEHGEGDTHAHDHGASGSTDPHIWGNVQNAIIAVDNISRALTLADPDMKAIYQSNAQAYIEQLRALDAAIKADVTKLPADERRLVTSHDALGYYCDAYGFTIVGTALGITTDEAEPSAKQVVNLIQQIKDAHVKAIFAENIENPALMESIAKEAGVTIGPPLYTDALGEPGTEGDTYIKMMTFNTNAIVSALLGQ
ncbi:MAG: zinc ABC transporter substrate-binding protein [Thermomicrobiales bacterium]